MADASTDTLRAKLTLPAIPASNANALILSPASTIDRPSSQSTHMTQNPPPTLQAAIHIGACSVSLLVVEKHPNVEEGPGDFLEQSIPLGRDIFRRGAIRRNTIERCVKILNGYRETLKELGATEDTPIRAVATNILSEAKNSDTFLNRIRIGCDLNVETIDEGEMTRLIYLKTRRRLRDTPSMKKRTALVVHVGPGNTRALLFKNGRISDYSNYRLGVYRTGEPLAGNGDSDISQNKLIREHIRSQISQIHHDYIDAGVEELVIIGYEIQHLAHELAKPGKTKSNYRALADLSHEISHMTEENRVKNYQLDYHTAHSVITALEMNLAIAETLQVETLRVPGSDYERGLLLDLPTSQSLSDGFQKEVLRSAESLARKFRVHRSHSAQVTRLSETLYDQTRELHQLGEHDALLLKCAAIIHECGNHISTRAHHKHSHYIIRHSEIFGLAQKDITLVALIARYHRKSEPRLSHQEYRSLNAQDRMRVSKLAAILRIADALDRSHSSRIGDIRIRIDKQKLHIDLLGITDASAERQAMRSKASLFQDIYGLTVSLHESR
ncbi:HD domain-containing protein [Verrucomicrobiaceae bacterium N1E253]|uniref:HD domain-containing protein n=1 Tax=Oceaniferula marina TaxID=2748318 RepID=A0A851GBN9_9BACT|nr:HD domain-containing protein [Oceaniferula marina]NWK54836.1 HD domain-containing protein [Oceaniferula marina]